MIRWIFRHIIFGAIFLLSTKVLGQDLEIDPIDQEIDPIQALFLEQLSLYPQEKIYVQTDKSHYFLGDTIWLRIHLVDAFLLKQANASRYVYVEMINQLSEVVNRTMITSDSLGHFYGHIEVGEDLPADSYTLRVYTKYMQNQGEDYFFRNPVYVIDPRVAGIESGLLIESENGILFESDIDLLNETGGFSGSGSNNETYDVSFFPEGGHAPLQTDIQIAFKALKENGLHEDISGVVYDDTGAEWARFDNSHLGMGQFRMHYLPDRTYHVVCTNKANVSHRFSLPEPEPNALALKTLWKDGSLRLTLSSSPNQELPVGLHLIAHIRGAVLFSQPWGDSPGFLFENDFFPAGVIHFILLDNERNIISERLAFSSESSSIADINVTQDKQVYEVRDKVNLTIRVTNDNDAPLTSNFSFSVVDMTDVPIDTISSIISAFLLTSELKGHVESPMDYFRDNSQKTIALLDVLMMTQGWRRYNVPEILKGNLQKELKFPAESNRQFTGRATGVFSSLKDGDISLIAFKDSILGSSFVNTEDDGRFVFSNVDYPDSTKFLVQALRKKGSTLAFIELDPIDLFPKVELPPLIYPGKQIFHDSYLSNVYKKQSMKNEMWVISLAEFEVKAKRIVPTKTESPYYSISSSNVIGAEEIKKANFLNVFDLLRRLPGVTISGNEVHYRRAIPMLILDNIPTENFDYSMLNVNDINDVFISPATSVMPIFGGRAANGAIVINTKRGFVQKNSLNRNMEEFTPIGYQQHVEFYSPVYETVEQRNDDTPDLRSTIYWNPSVSTDSTGTTDLSFYSSDFPSQYAIIIEGVSSLGHLIYSSKEIIEVNNTDKLKNHNQ